MNNFSEDNEAYYEVRQRLLNEVRPFSGLKAAAGGLVANPTDMSDVQIKVSDFQFKMKEINAALKDAQPFMQITDQERFFTQFYVDRAALARLAAIAAVNEFAQFGVFFALEDPDTRGPLKDLKAAGFGRLTCCFVGLDKDNNVLGVHFPGPDGAPPLMKAEENWPPPPPPKTTPKVLNLTQNTTQVFAFFNKPGVAAAAPAK